MHETLAGRARLEHLGVIRVSGRDAGTFLQSQLTQDVRALDSQTAALAAWCSAKGRMLASFVVIREPDGSHLLVLARDVLAQTLRRLAMFVLRADVKLQDASADLALWGLAGDAVPADLRACNQPWRRSDPSPGAATVLLYPGEGVPLALRIAAAGQEPAGADMPAERWSWLEVSAGVARIGAALSDQLVPQMVNYESVGGVSFRKGCYPGQEVVARSQFRGTLKRRGHVVESTGALTPALPLYGPADPDQPCGIVVQAAMGPDGHARAIASIQMQAAGAGGLRAGTPDGAPVSVLPLPYRLVEDV